MVDDLPEPPTEGLSLDPRGIRNLLAEHPFFADLDENDLAFVAGCGANTSFRAGDTIFRQGGRADSLYVLRRGQVAIETHAPKQNHVLVDTVGAGDVLGWSWLFPPFRWHFDARAVEDTRAIALDSQCLRGKCDEDPRFGYLMMQRFARLAGERMQATRLRLLEEHGTPATPKGAGS